MYRLRIRDQYDHLSRSYRKVADFVLSRYYEVAFMTAAQLAFVVDVDTTTVVRFSQRLGYDGYPELLHDIREQVKAEIYAVYEPAPLAPDDPGAVFARRAEIERHAISQMVVHSPPDHVVRTVAMLARARRILLVGDGHAHAVAVMAAIQLSHFGLEAHACDDDSALLAGALAALEVGDLVIGISASEHGREVARAIDYARSRGVATIGVVGSLASPVNRACDWVIYAPVVDAGPLPGVVPLAAALSALISAYAASHVGQWLRREEGIAAAFAYLVQPDSAAPDDESS